MRSSRVIVFTFLTGCLGFVVVAGGRQIIRDKVAQGHASTEAQVAELVKVARAQLKGGDQSGALTTLAKAASLEGATNRDEAVRLLEQVAADRSQEASITRMVTGTPPPPPLPLRPPPSGLDCRAASRRLFRGAVLVL
jgi:hypothetical protein